MDVKANPQSPFYDAFKPSEAHYEQKRLLMYPYIPLSGGAGGRRREGEEGKRESSLFRCLLMMFVAPMGERCVREHLGCVHFVHTYQTYTCLHFPSDLEMGYWELAGSGK